jgi:hypothetical protein
VEEASEPPTEVWPDNLPAVNFFIALGGGSWNMGPNGPTGLRPEAFREVRLARRIRAGDWPDIFQDLRVLEDAALETMRKKP